MMMVGRKYIKDELHRYAFNGKEYDNEITQYDYGFRIYDPRLGRFLSVDPLRNSYPWYTPYQFAGNNSIWAIDLDGLEEEKVNENTGSSNPNDVFLNPDGTIKQYKLEEVVIKLSDKGFFDNIWNKVIKAVKHVTIFSLSVANAYATDNMLGAGRIDPGIFGEEYKTTATIGLKTGDIIALASGIQEIFMGATGEVVGFGFDATGIGAPMGVGVGVVSTGVIVHGISTVGTAWNNLIKVETASEIIHGNAPLNNDITENTSSDGAPEENAIPYEKIPPADSPIKLRGDQGWKDKNGNIWKKDQLHKDHWDVSDKKGRKIKEVDYYGNQIWPDGPKNKNK